MLNFTVDAGAPRSLLLHYWEKCVGSCHAYTALRADWQKQLMKAHNELGFNYVRFHGIFNDDMSIVTKDDKTGALQYCFLNADLIFDFLLKNGMKPFVEFSFMPSALASTQTTCFHYKGNVSLPRSFSLWEDLISRFVQHLVSRYGLAELRTWFFEVWNEPNLEYFFEGSQQDYFRLYESTARAVKNVDSLLPVGGPSTAINDWIPDLIAFCQSKDVPLDFISTHHYPTDDPFWKKRIQGASSVEQLLHHLDVNAPRRYERGVLKKMTARARGEAGSLPLYYTEWNSSAINPDGLHDLPYSAAFTAKTIIDNLGLVDGYSYWTFTDIFEEGAQLAGEFHGGFGLQTVHGIPKPVYHTFKFLHQLGNERLPACDEQETVGILASSKTDEICILAYNHQIPEHAITSQTIRIFVTGLDINRAELSLVDGTHGNAKEKWKEIGAPDYPNSVELIALNDASKIFTQTIPVQNTNDGQYVEFTLEPHAVALLRLLN